MILIFKDFLGDEYDNIENISFVITTDKEELTEEIIINEYRSVIREKVFETIKKECLEIYDNTPKFKRLQSKISKKYTLYNFVIDNYGGKEEKFEEIYL